MIRKRATPPSSRFRQTASRHTLRLRLERAMDVYLHDCYARRTAVRVSELASDLGFSREHLTRLFLLAFGAPPHAVLRRRQLQRAETLLRTTSASIIEIAVAAGFGTHRAFYRAFRATFGTTPGRFRKLTK